jgi:uncharacterized protein (TIGR00251 family)
MAGCRLEIKAVPNAPRSEVIGWLGPALKVKVHAPPVEGKANEVLCAFLAETLCLPKRAVRVDHGATFRKKLLIIDELSLEEVYSKLPPRSG